MSMWALRCPWKAPTGAQKPKPAPDLGLYDVLKQALDLVKTIDLPPNPNRFA